MKDVTKEKDNYIMHCSYNEHFKLLTDEELGRLIRNVNDYVQNGVLPQYSNEERVLNMAFSFMRTTIDIEKEKYLEKCRKNKENGKRGGRPRNPEKPNGFDENPPQPKKADNDIDIDMEIDIDNDIDIGIDNDIDNKSVCDNNANARAKNFNCHLGSSYKSESCFYCMKKDKCPNAESADFKLTHPDESFVEWNKRKTDSMNKIIEDLKARGKPVKMELFDYDWLNDRD